MHANEQLIHTFYNAFAKRDSTTMAECYAVNPYFSDPVFVSLNGATVPGMWHMLCGRAKDLQVAASNITANDVAGSAHWEARYHFSTGRMVHNVIEAKFTFTDGKIKTHIDSFDLYKWARQALGLKGTLLGWTPLVQSAIRKQATRGLVTFMAKQL
ncbi:MAG: nuclear transport factor 2 family protein [Gemmatimonadaceae bacterium]